MLPENPVGVFDSGVGGLSVLREVHKLLPQENLLYVADTAYAPYGDKSKEFILGRTTSIVDFFLSQQVKAIVIACNTATGAAAKEMRHHYNLPIIAMEPAVKPAAEQTKTGIIGVLATSRTLSSNNFQILFSRFADKVKILPQACPGLVELIEAGNLYGDEIRNLLTQYLQPLIKQKADIVVLGCTHYPFLTGMIQEIVGPSVVVIDSGLAVARTLKMRLEMENLLMNASFPATVQFFSSAAIDRSRQVISELWGKPVSLMALPEQVLL